MQYQLTLTERLLDETALADKVDSYSWEVGRLVIDPHYRSGSKFLKQCLYLSLCALCELKKAEKLFASCTYILSRLYGRFGFSLLTKEARLNNTEKIYSLIYGEVPTVMKALTPEEDYFV